jgi:hypothetical protein
MRGGHAVRVLVRLFGAGSDALIDRARDNALFARMAARDSVPFVRSCSLTQSSY